MLEILQEVRIVIVGKQSNLKLVFVCVCVSRNLAIFDIAHCSW